MVAATNPFPATGGADEETLDHVRAAAPHAFRSRQFRAVRAEDYTATARELPWVINARHGRTLDRELAQRLYHRPARGRA